MFATMRRKSRNRRMKNEFGLGMDHFKRAASLAAQETGATVGPRLNAAKDRVQPAATKAKDAASSGWDSAVATLTPLVGAATEQVLQTSSKVTGKPARKTTKENQKNARKLEKRANKALARKSGRSKSKLFGYALLGTAIGLGAAYAAKRRKAAQWDEYDPAAPISTAQAGADDAAFEPDGTSPNGTTSDPAKQSPR